VEKKKEKGKTEGEVRENEDNRADNKGRSTTPEAKAGCPKRRIGEG